MVKPRRAAKTIDRPKFTPSAQASPLEVIGIQEKIEAGDAQPWMAERLKELIRDRSSPACFEAAKLALDVLHPPEERRPARVLGPKKVRPRS